MGAKTWLLAYVHVNARAALKARPVFNREALPLDPDTIPLVR